MIRVRITNPKVAGAIKNILGTDTLLVTKPRPVNYSFPLPVGQALAFFVDLSHLTREQRAQLVSYYVNHYTGPQPLESAVRKLEIAACGFLGVPLLAAHCEVIASTGEPRRTVYES